MSDDRAQARGAPVVGLLPVLGRYATVLEQLRARCVTLDAEAASLRAQVLWEQEEGDGDAARIALEHLHRTYPSARGDDGADVRNSGLDIRPYMMTRGRTVPRRDVAVEALVMTVDGLEWDSPSLSPEYYDIADLCQQARSLAEISSLLDIPLTVARILVADMAAEGLVYIYDPPSDHTPDQRLLEKVLGGLRKL